jgi:hypothetical protein
MLSKGLLDSHELLKVLANVAALRLWIVVNTEQAVFEVGLDIRNLLGSNDLRMNRA